MDRLPRELLHYILLYIDQPLDLFRISCVCSRWRAVIMNDEYLLNQWFSRSLKNSQESFQGSWPYFRIADKRQLLSNIDQSLFPVNLQSDEWCVLPWPVAKYASHAEVSSMYYYPISLFRSSHSFSFWLFLPRQCYFYIHITNLSVNGVHIWLCDDRKYHCDGGKLLSIADRWTHVVVSKLDSRSSYQLCIDGEHLSTLSRHDMSLIKADQHIIAPQNIIVFHVGKVSTRFDSFSPDSLFHLG